MNSTYELHYLLTSYTNYRNHPITHKPIILTYFSKVYLSKITYVCLYEVYSFFPSNLYKVYVRVTIAKF